jgi:hypothetical protein
MELTLFAPEAPVCVPCIDRSIAWMYVHMHVYVYAHTHTHTHTHTRTHTHVYIYIYICIYTEREIERKRKRGRERERGREGERRERYIVRERERARTRTHLHMFDRGCRQHRHELTVGDERPSIKPPHQRTICTLCVCVCVCVSIISPLDMSDRLSTPPNAPSLSLPLPLSLYAPSLCTPYLSSSSSSLSF